jgi:hypothetical protein
MHSLIIIIIILNPLSLIACLALLSNPAVLMQGLQHKVDEWLKLLAGKVGEKDSDKLVAYGLGSMILLLTISTWLSSSV